MSSRAQEVAMHMHRGTARALGDSTENQNMRTKEDRPWSGQLCERFAVLHIGGMRMVLVSVSVWGMVV